MQAGYADTALLLRRAGFGGIDSEIRSYQHLSWNELVDLVLDTSRAPGPGPRPNLSSSISYYDRWTNMVHYWLDRARRPVDRAPIVEKMTLFWHGHLCTSLDKIFNHKTLFDQNELYRRLGMGDFKSLIRATSIDPAMLDYLDNTRNTVTTPNENFARELMELFVTGVGHYSEDDVKESTRAWTGHGINDNNVYRFDRSQHDNGTKRFMGRSGNFDGFDIIDILLAERRDAHARFLSQKLWSFFAYPIALNDSVVSDISRAYQPSLNITDALRAIFLHPKFRSTKSRNGLVRSPTEYAVALMRHTGTDCSTARPEWFIEQMGQRLFAPPNVSGWKQNEYWLSEPAVWAKATMASHVRWHTYSRDDLGDAIEITDYDTFTYKYTPDQNIARSQANYQLEPLSAATKQVMREYIATERKSDRRWGERAGLLMLPLISPEMQMA